MGFFDFLKPDPYANALAIYQRACASAKGNGKDPEKDPLCRALEKKADALKPSDTAP